MYRNILPKWELSSNPFNAQAPYDEAKRTKVFTGREKELDKVFALIADPRVFVPIGHYGSGKTMFMREVMSRLRRQERDYLISYTIYRPGTDFINVILRSLARELAKLNVDAAKKVYTVLTRGSVTSTIEKTGSLESKLSLLENYFKAGRTDKVVETVDQVEIKDPYNALSELSSENRRHALLIIDDVVSGYIDLARVERLIADARFAKDHGCSIMIPSYPTMVANRLQTHSAGAFEEIYLHQLPKTDLVQVLIRYLNSERAKPRGDPFPFTQGAAEWLAERMVNPDYASFLTPRLFVLACKHYLDMAAEDEISEIDAKDMEHHWRYVQGRLFNSLEDWDKEFFLLKAIYEQGGISEETDFETFMEIMGGDKLVDFDDVVAEKLQPLVEAHILVAGERPQPQPRNAAPVGPEEAYTIAAHEGYQRRFTLNPIFEDQYLRKLFTSEEKHPPKTELFTNAFGPDWLRYSTMAPPEK